MTTAQTSDLAAIKDRQQKAWSSGDYGKVANFEDRLPRMILCSHSLAGVFVRVILRPPSEDTAVPLVRLTALSPSGSLTLGIPIL
jgi:hypothetical protein